MRTSQTDGQGMANDRRMRNGFTAPFLFQLLFALLFLRNTFTAPEVRLLALNRSGSSTVIISADQKQAFIKDGGRAGEDGTNGAIIEGKPILPYLKLQGATNLTIVCSHPQADHMAGLVEIARKPEENSVLFQRTAFV